MADQFARLLHHPADREVDGFRRSDHPFAHGLRQHRQQPVGARVPRRRNAAHEMRMLPAVGHTEMTGEDRQTMPKPMCDTAHMCRQKIDAACPAASRRGGKSTR